LTEHNRQLAKAGEDLLTDQVGSRFPLKTVCPPNMLGPMVSLCLPDDLRPDDVDRGTSPTASLRLHTVLREEFGVQVPVFYWPEAPRRMFRISAQAYNCLEDYARLAAALGQILGR